MPMIKNYFMTAFRRMYRQKGYTLTNLLGITLGIICCLLAFLIIQYDSGFDRFHRKFDRIYRIVTDEQTNGILNPGMGTPMPLAAALRADFPGLEKVAVTFGQSGPLIEVKQDDGTVRLFQHRRDAAFLEPDFFQIFDFPWLAGDPHALAEPNTAAITESLARQYFGTTDVLGRTVRAENKVDLKIVGLMKDFPAQTDFPFTLVISLRTVLTFLPQMDSWRSISSNVNTWVLLAPGASAAALARALPAFKNKYYPDSSDPTKRVHHVQPLADVHLDSRYGSYSERSVSLPLLVALGLIGAFVLVTACINFVNMATAQAMTRAREVGVRKVLGAARSRLALQYLFETFLLTFVSTVITFVFAEPLLAAANSFLGIGLKLDPLGSPALAAFTVSLVVLVTLLAGFYPALVLSGFAPAQALKGKAGRTARGGVLLRRGLVVIQFVISQALIIGTIVITAQLDYWRSKDMGFAREALVIVDVPEDDAATLERLRTQLLADSRIRDVTFCLSSASSASDWDGVVRHTIHGPEEEYIVDMKFADAEFASVYGLRFVAGRNYMASDSITEVVVNETFARKLGVAPHDLLGRMVRVGRRGPTPIVGVVRDFHARPLQSEIRPTLLAAQRRAYREATIKLAGTDVQGALTGIERVWTAAFPHFLFSAQFLDERIASFYSDEQKTSTIMRIFTAVAIFIGTIGLFGLVSFMAARRTKEIGVRKVLGASVADVLFLFAREFILLILTAFVVAAPAAYLAMRSWLDSFAYRIDLGPGVFVLAAGATFAIAALSVGYQVMKASLANPVEALRYE